METKDGQYKPEPEDLTLEEFSIEELEDTSRIAENFGRQLQLLVPEPLERRFRRRCGSHKAKKKGSEAMENKSERKRIEPEDLTLEEFSIEELEDRLELLRLSDGNCHCAGS